MTGGQVRVRGCAQDRLATAINTLQRMGAHFDINDEWITASASRLRPAAVQTDPHPGFMTDWQPPLIVLMTQADGMSVFPAIGQAHDWTNVTNAQPVYRLLHD